MFLRRLFFKGLHGVVTVLRVESTGAVCLLVLRSNPSSSRCFADSSRIGVCKLAKDIQNGAFLGKHRLGSKSSYEVRQLHYLLGRFVFLKGYGL